MFPSIFKHFNYIKYAKCIFYDHIEINGETHITTIIPSLEFF